jgi:hypothetical protein
MRSVLHPVETVRRAYFAAIAATKASMSSTRAPTTLRPFDLRKSRKCVQQSMSFTKVDADRPPWRRR